MHLFTGGGSTSVLDDAVPHSFEEHIIVRVAYNLPIYHFRYVWDSTWRIRAAHDTSNTRIMISIRIGYKYNWSSYEAAEECFNFVHVSLLSWVKYLSLNPSTAHQLDFAFRLTSGAI